MVKIKKILFLTCLLVFCSLGSGVSADTTYVLDESYGNVPVIFVPNVGQFDSTIALAAEGNDGDVLGANYGAVFQLESDDTVSPWYPDNTDFNEKLHLQFVNANLNPEVSFEEPVEWNSNYFIGNDPEQWHTDVPNYRIARLHDIYPGIDMMFRANGRDIEYLLVITPGADGSQILFRDYDGYINGAAGKTLHGQKLWHNLEYVNYSRADAISAFQIIDGEEVQYPVSFKFIPGDIRIGDTGFRYMDYVAFNIGRHKDGYEPINNTGYDIYIKLDMFDSPFIALKHTTDVAGVEVDNEGCVYVAGNAEYKRTSFEFKTLFAMKINTAGDGLEYVTYFGGNIYSGKVSSLVIDIGGNIYIAGNNISNDFPTTIGSFDTNIESGGKSFVLKLNYQGNAIIYSTYLGGSDGDTIHDVSINEFGNVFIAGMTISQDFPVTSGAYDETFNYNNNGFIAILSPAGDDLIRSTYIELGRCKTIGLFNSEVIFSAGNSIVYIVKMKPDLSDTLYTIRLSASTRDYITGMDIDNEGNIFIAGYTMSEDFYTTDGSVYKGGRSDCFIAKVRNNGSLAWSRLLGGSLLDEPTGGLKVNFKGNIYISGFTTSPEFPTTPDAYLNDIMHGNGFFTVINSDGINIKYSTLLSGSVSYGKAIDAKSDVYLASSSSLPELSGKGVFDSNNISLVKFKASNATTVNNEFSQPKLFTVQTPYPNPFNPSVILSYRLFRDSDVILDIFNINGQKISTVVNAFQAKGLHNIQWDGSDYPSGVYFFRLHVGHEVKIGKLMLLK